MCERVPVKAPVLFPVWTRYGKRDFINPRDATFLLSSELTFCTPKRHVGHTACTFYMFIPKKGVILKF